MIAFTLIMGVVRSGISSRSLTMDDPGVALERLSGIQGLDLISSTIFASLKLLSLRIKLSKKIVKSLIASAKHSNVTVYMYCLIMDSSLLRHGSILLSSLIAPLSTSNSYLI